jgi:glycerol-3-phosphate acyltransferase PlsY
MSTIIFFVLAAVIGYLLGSIPFGLIFVRLFSGKDVRAVGSGRTGGTNSYRAGGMIAGILTVLFDGFKGLFGVVFTVMLSDAMGMADVLPWGQVIAGIFSVVGHNYSIYIGFKGGAGTGPNVGWATYLWWPITFISIIAAVVLFRFIGMASVVSLFVALVIPVTFLIRYLVLDGQPIAYTIGGLITLFLVFWALRPNLKRIMDGNERVVGPRASKKKENNQ